MILLPSSCADCRFLIRAGEAIPELQLPPDVKWIKTINPYCIIWRIDIMNPATSQCQCGIGKDL